MYFYIIIRTLMPGPNLKAIHPIIVERHNGGSTGKVKRSRKSAWFIVWEPWMSRQHFMAIHLLVVDHLVSYSSAAEMKEKKSPIDVTLRLKPNLWLYVFLIIWVNWLFNACDVWHPATLRLITNKNKSANMFLKNTELKKKSKQ